MQHLSSLSLLFSQCLIIFIFRTIVRPVQGSFHIFRGTQYLRKNFKFETENKTFFVFPIILFFSVFVFYSCTSVKPEEMGNLFPAIEVPSQRDGTCCWQPQALTRLKDGPTLKKTSLDASTNMEARKLFHLIRRRSKLPWRFSFAHHSQFQVLSQSQQAYCIF